MLNATGRAVVRRAYRFRPSGFTTSIVSFYRHFAVAVGVLPVFTLSAAARLHITIHWPPGALGNNASEDNLRCLAVRPSCFLADFECTGCTEHRWRHDGGCSSFGNGERRSSRALAYRAC